MTKSRIIIIVIIKTSRTGRGGKTKIVYKLLSQPHKHLRHGKLKNKLREATNDWLLPQTHLTFLCQTQYREGHSTHESGPAGNTLQIRIFCTLILQTLMDELQPCSGMSSSDRSRWKLTEQTMIRFRISITYTVQQHDVDDTTTRKSDQGKDLPPNSPGAREAENDIQHRTPTLENNTQGLGKQMHSSNDATQRCPQRHASPTSKYQFFERHERHMVFESKLAVKPHAKNIEVGTSANGNPREDQVCMGRVHSPGSTNH